MATFDHDSFVQEGLTLLHGEMTEVTDREHGTTRREVWCKEKVDGAEGIVVFYSGPGVMKHLPVHYHEQRSYWVYDFGDVLFMERHDANGWHFEHANNITWLRVAYRDGRFPHSFPKDADFPELAGIPQPATYGPNQTPRT